MLLPVELWEYIAKYGALKQICLIVRGVDARLVAKRRILIAWDRYKENRQHMRLSPGSVWLVRPVGDAASTCVCTVLGEPWSDACAGVQALRVFCGGAATKRILFLRNTRDERYSLRRLYIDWPRMPSRDACIV
jgi:hypothetical protein